jgi:hypothetical protein
MAGEPVDDPTVFLADCTDSGVGLKDALEMRDNPPAVGRDPPPHHN